jgi:hypothetical protein
MGKWATYRRRGGATVPPVDSPVLFLVAVEDLEWTWSGDDPFTWLIDQSVDPTGPWVNFDSADGNLRDSGPVPGDFWYSIIGVDIANNPVTGRSNAVHREP